MYLPIYTCIQTNHTTRSELGAYFVLFTCECCNPLKETAPKVGVDACFYDSDFCR